MPEVTTPTPVAPPAEEAPRADPLASAVADAVAKLRRTAGLSERAAAKKLGTSQTQLRRMEDPRYLPSLRSLARVATAYGAHLLVSFETPETAAKEKPAAAPRSAPPRTVRASASPSRSRPAAQGRGRAGSRRPARGSARRREAR